MVIVVRQFHCVPGSIADEGKEGKGKHQHNRNEENEAGWEIRFVCNLEGEIIGPFVFIFSIFYINNWLLLSKKLIIDYLVTLINYLYCVPKYKILIDPNLLILLHDSI